MKLSKHNGEKLISKKQGGRKLTSEKEFNKGMKITHDIQEAQGARLGTAKLFKRNFSKPKLDACLANSELYPALRRTVLGN